MASSSSLTHSQAILSRFAISRHGSSQNVHTYSISSALPYFSGPKSTPSSTISRRRIAATLTKHLPVRAFAAVETLEKTTGTELIEKSTNTIRFLSIDAMEKANSGNPSLPMGVGPDMSEIVKRLTVTKKTPC